MERTKNLNLIKPAVSEYYDVEQFNQNSDIIDEAIQQNSEDIEEVDKRLTTADGLKFQFAKNEDGTCGYLNENGEFVAFKQGGSNSVVLPPAPELTVGSDDGKLTLSWEQPDATECEVDIASYNIYMSETAPFSLADMQLIASQEAGYKKMDYEYTLDVDESDFTLKVRNNQVYIDGENYAEYYISPALQFEAGKSYRLSGADGTKCRMFIYGSDAINNGTIVTDAGDGCEFTASESAALPLALSIEPDRNTDSRFHIGIEEKVGDNSYVIEGLENGKVYFIAVQAVTVDGIENASIYKIHRGVPTAIIFACVINYKAYKSFDGINWTETKDGACAVTYGDNKFVIACKDGSTYYSADCENWVAMGNMDITPAQLVYGDGIFFCRGSQYIRYYDGSAWVDKSSCSLHINDVAYANGRFVGISSANTNNVHYWQSSDMTKYVTTYGSSASMRRIERGNNRFVMIQSTSSYASSDGQTWSSLSGLSGFGTVQELAYGNGMFVACASNGQMATLADGSTSWVKRTFIESNMDVKCLSFVKDRFICTYIDEDGNDKVAWSENGVNWTIELTNLAGAQIVCNR